jgi:hypothetical protein
MLNLTSRIGALQLSRALKLIIPILCILQSIAAQPAPSEKGPPVGAKIPAFEGRDQFGRAQTLDSLTAAKGLVLLFFRSADW